MRVMIVGLLAVSMTTSATIDLDAAANYRSRSRAFLGADSVVQAYFHEVLVISRQLGRFPTQAELDAISPVTPPDIEILEIDAERVRSWLFARSAAEPRDTWSEDSLAPYFVDHLRRSLPEGFSDEQLEREGRLERNPAGLLGILPDVPDLVFRVVELE